jgi:hypothetical protein
MMQMILEISDELEQRLRPLQDDLPRIIELGLREHYAAAQGGFHGTAEIMEFLATLPDPEAILALRPSPAMQERISDLVEKSQAGGLTVDEEQEWEQYQFLEHLVRLAKIQARARLNAAAADA